MTLRKKRPTKRDAEDAKRRGSHGIDAGDYVSHEERLAQVDHFAALVLDLIRRDLARTRRLDLTILRGHSIIDIALTQFIELASRNQAAMENARFAFHQKVTIAYALGLTPDPFLFGTLDALTEARNTFAHRLEVDVQAVNTAIRYNSEHSAAGVAALTESQKASTLRRIVAGICGGIVGQLRAMVAIDVPEEAYRKYHHQR
jgi:hypothetical protein